MLREPAQNLFHITELKLEANALGIKKIDFGRHGGRILFGAKPNVDVEKIIALIQGEPKVYKMEGGDKLRVIKEMAEGEERVKTLGKILEMLV
uniref:TRCF domain-containing protein n=1 Tax=Candidatus Kentrum sp. TUN TaxID=2126343 RepID=A0A450ZZL8_9GAMM|nr:MAG: TRCF domain-containing protein [Candidatus Kentron sp. TUN]